MNNLGKTKVIKVLSTLIIAIIVITGIISVNKDKTIVAKEPIKIGMVAGFTGAASTWSDMARKSIDLAVKEANNTGGINGRNIQMVYEDSQTNPTKGVSAFNKLVSVDNVSIVFGDMWSFITNPLIPLAEQKKVVLISPTVMDISVEKANPYFYSLGHTVDSQREATEKFFDLNKDIKTISILYWNDMWGNANKGLVLQIAKEKGIKVLSMDGVNDFSATYQTEVTKVKVQNPDAIYFNTGLPDTVLKKIKDLGLGDKKVLTTSLVVDAIEVNKTPLSYLKNVYFTNWAPNDEFVSKFKKEYGVYPIVEAQNSYDMARAVILALKAGGDFSSALHSVKFTGVEGYSIDFTQKDQVRVNTGKTDLYTYDGVYRKVN